MKFRLLDTIIIVLLSAFLVWVGFRSNLLSLQFIGLILVMAYSTNIVYILRAIREMKRQKRTIQKLHTLMMDMKKKIENNEIEKPSHVYVSEVDGEPAIVSKEEFEAAMEEKELREFKKIEDELLNK